MAELAYTQLDQHPAHEDHPHGWRRYVSALARFGLTPADREKVSRGESDSDDPMLTMIEGGRA